MLEARRTNYREVIIVRGLWLSYEFMNDRERNNANRHVKGIIFGRQTDNLPFRVSVVESEGEG